MDERQLAIRVKAQLRKRMRQVRASMPTETLAERSRAIVQRVRELAPWQSARSVALFSPMPHKHEVDIRELDAAARAEGKRVAYPFMRARGQGFATGFAWTEDVETLADRGRGFPEPDAGAAAAGAGELDLIIVPALAVAPTGHRVGFGRGWYDATLGEFQPAAVCVAVAFDFQLLVELPVEEHDVACDWVVTDTRAIVATSA